MRHDPTTRDELRRCGRLLCDRGLVWGHSGNISARLAPNAFLISAAGTDLGALDEDDFVRCEIDRDSCRGDRRPSIEAGMHRGIYAACERAAAVIHSQPFYSTLVACSDIDVRTDLLPEAMAYLRAVGRVPYHHAGSRELAEAVASKACQSRALLLANHGVICWGTSLSDALLKTETLEFLCRLLVEARGSGLTLNYVGQDAVEDFLRHLRQTGPQA